MPEPTFGAWLQRQLDRREWNQSDLSRKSGVSHGRISDWIRDVRLPNPESCDKLADALGIEPDEVLQRAGHRHAPVSDPERAALVSLLRRVELREDRPLLIRTMLEGMIDYDRKKAATK